MKRLFMLLLIALLGAGIAFGATTLFFSPSSQRAEVTEADGLVDDLSDDAVAAPRTPKPPKVPDADEREASGPPSGEVSAGTDGGASAGVTNSGGTIATAVNGPLGQDGDDLDPIEAECRDEDNERDRDRCEKELEAEAEEEEDEREEEEDEADEEADENRD